MILGSMIGLIEGDTRSLDYGPYNILSPAFLPPWDKGAHYFGQPGFLDKT